MVRPAKGGFTEGSTGEDETVEWQRLFADLSNDLNNGTITDADLVQRYFDFISRYPEKRILEDIRSFIDQMMRKRPGTIPIIEKYVDKAKLNEKKAE